MKNKYNILFLFIAVLLITSCDDFLNPEAPSSFDADYLFSSPGDAEKVLMGAYALFNTDDYTSRMAQVWMQNTDVEAMGVGVNDGGDRRSVWALEPNRLTNFSEMDSRWNNNYQAIDRCNQVIEGIAASAVKDDRDMEMLFAEANCLRAYRYFLLCNFWGDVPYFREASKAGMDIDRPKTDKNIIYSGIIQDLVDNEGNMYYMNQFSDGVERMNREFTLGMIARLSLFRAGYGMTKDGTMKRADDYLDINDPELAVTYTADGQTKTARTSSDYYELAKTYCQKLMNERPKTLNSNFAQIFRNECEQIIQTNTSDGEILYEVAHGTGTVSSRGDVGWCIGVGVSSSSKGTTTIQVNFTPTYYFTFDPKDIRRNVTCSLVSYASDTEQRIVSSTSMTAGKWNRLWMNNDQGSQSSKSTGINWPLMRYSDILLMLAEAENELNGPTALAKNALIQVRLRAFNEADQTEKVYNYVSNLSSKDAFFNAIVDERAWEFGGECLRKFDLIRWNLYGKKIVETKNTINNMGKAARGVEVETPEVAKYLNLADIVYYERIAGTIRFLNLPDTKNLIPPADAIVESDANGYVSGEGMYAMKNWTLDLWTTSNAPASYTLYSWRGYTDETGESAVPYLLPIGSQTISTSRVLNNNGYCFSY